MTPASATNQPLTTEQLATQHILRGESENNLRWLLEHAQYETFAAGDVLLTPERDNHTLYLILSGRVQVRLDWQGHEALTFLDVGHCVGEMSIIERKRPSAIVVTDCVCQLLLIHEEVLWSLVERSGTLARNLLYMLSSRVRKDNLVIFESRQQQAISEQHSRIDALTGLFNRRWLESSLPRLATHAQSQQQPLCVIMLDVDHFKHYNDSHGHRAGDAALAALGHDLGDNIRPCDYAVRYGGEEFIVILPDTTVSDARIIAERLRELLRNMNILDQDGKPLPPITVSMGLAELKARQTMDTLIEAADVALYRAKHAGRDRVAL
ncbi:GGDEF domain-containing protein [Sulfuriflexus mobilis]|uniref:GGDEF domain-containing protein n=1 Tax=Sulfuriflexus mobilis TaxID=1811807 RepID=UPI000F84CDFB|nr:GGDEF domain-containing protein [Sulfuriflexus mobilis]